MSRINHLFFTMQLVDGNSVALSRQEVKCLIYLTQGYTYANAANCLKLSHRTVEFYVGNIRVKSGYRTKETLLTILNASHFNERVKASCLLEKCFGKPIS